LIIHFRILSFVDPFHLRSIMLSNKRESNANRPIDIGIDTRSHQSDNRLSRDSRTDVTNSQTTASRSSPRRVIASFRDRRDDLLSSSFSSRDIVVRAEVQVPWARFRALAASGVVKNRAAKSAERESRATLKARARNRTHAELECVTGMHYHHPCLPPLVLIMAVPAGWHVSRASARDYSS